MFYFLKLFELSEINLSIVSVVICICLSISIIALKSLTPSTLRLNFHRGFDLLVGNLQMLFLLERQALWTLRNPWSILCKTNFQEISCIKIDHLY